MTDVDLTKGDGINGVEALLHIVPEANCVMVAHHPDWGGMVSVHPANDATHEEWSIGLVTAEAEVRKAQRQGITVYEAR